MKVHELADKNFLGTATSAYVIVNYKDSAMDAPGTYKVTLNELGNYIASSLGLAYCGDDRNINKKTIGANTYTSASQGVYLSPEQRTKLNGIADGAEVNVQANWTETNSSSDAYIQNKPPLGTASPKDVAASGNASVTQVVMGNDTRLSDARTPVSHTHGNISNSGDITSNATIASGDRLVINDESDSQLTNSSITFGTADNQVLGNNGTWLNLKAWAQADTKPSYTYTEVGAAPASHPHGDITNSGDITTNTTIASGDRLVINSEANSKITNSSITFGTSQATVLGNDGTWVALPTTLPASDVAAWAKAETKPTYTMTEIGVAEWAQAATKPTYTAAEVGAYELPSGGIPATDLAETYLTDTDIENLAPVDAPEFTTSITLGNTTVTETQLIALLALLEPSEEEEPTEPEG